LATIQIFLGFLKKILVFNLIILILSFLSRNFILFFVFFEISLIPILTIILGWGSTPERLTAGSYLIIYTLIFSVPFFFLLIFLYYKKERFSFGLYNPICKFSEIFSIDWILIFWLLSFLVKVPMYGLHLWLAKAHVEAPVFGSMLLAAILLKLGLYGLIRSYYFWNFKKLILKKILQNFFIFWFSLFWFSLFSSDRYKEFNSLFISSTYDVRTYKFKYFFFFLILKEYFLCLFFMVLSLLLYFLVLKLFTKLQILVKFY